MGGKELKVFTVIGARPQFIKAAMISRLIAKDNCINEVIVHTGQHYDAEMSDVFFQEMGIPQPKYNLGIGSLSHGAQTGRMLEALEKVLLEEKPQILLVYGDTNSTLAGALAAAKLHIPVGHVEAGLRSFNRKMPEELNRILTDHISSLLFAPTDVGVKNLLNEGIPVNKIVLSGDVMYDASLYFAAKAEKEKENILKRMDMESKSYILATIHRAENTDSEKRLRAIMGALREMAKEIPIIMPLHPRTESKLKDYGMDYKISGGFTSLNGIKDKASDNNANTGLLLIKPVGYPNMLLLEKNAKLVVTDSGGVQKEAFFFKVPCATLRGETEWVELTDAGWNRCFINDSELDIKDFIFSMVEAKGEEKTALFGDGDAAGKILKVIKDHKDFF